MFNLARRIHIFLRNKAASYRFVSDAEREGITFGDGVKPTERPVDDIMSLHDDCTLCFLGWAGRMAYHHSKNTVKRINYEKYINGDVDYIIR